MKEKAMSDAQDEIKSKLGLKSGGRTIRVWSILLVVFAILIAAFVFWQAPRSDQDALGYRFAPVARGDLTVAINATGSVEPTSMVDISSELSGTIAEVFVDFNDVIASGEVLARLDTSKLEAQVEVQRANLRSAEARLERARVNLDEAQSTAERTRALGDRGVATGQSVFAAEAALARAVAELKIAEADVSVATANLLLTETDLTHACICSPVEGIVLHRTINPGQTISAAMSAPVLFTIAEDLTEMELQLAVDEADIARLVAGQPATFEVDAYDDTPFPATVRHIRFAPETVDGVVTYTVILDIENEDLALRPGMTAVADIVVNEVTDTLLIPNAALRFVPRIEQEPTSDEDSGGGLLSMILPTPPTRSTAPRSSSSVWVLRDGEPVEIQIVAGDTDGRFTEIQDGLQEGDQVIVGQDA
jgi:HlyD family secretion protein